MENILLKLTEEEVSRIFYALQMVNCTSVEGVKNIQLAQKLDYQVKQQINKQENGTEKTI